MGTLFYGEQTLCLQVMYIDFSSHYAVVTALVIHIVCSS